MEKTPETKTPQFDVEKAWERAKLLEKDLDTGNGWTRRFHVPNEFKSWSKTFPNEKVPVKVVYRLENMPMSAEKLIEMLSPKNLELRSKWDKTTALEVLEKLPNGGCIVHSVLNLSFPLSDRDYVLYCSPSFEIDDWFERKAFGIFEYDATSPSRPAGADGIVRATNGGNFYIAVQDEEEPGHKCEVFTLSTNKYNGWLPSKNEWLVGRKAPRVFFHLRECIVDGYKEYFN